MRYLCILSLASLVAFLRGPAAVRAQQDDDLGGYLSLNDSILGNDAYPIDESHARCQPMKIPICEDVPYNQTLLPNILGHHSQDEIIKEINMYHALLKVNCSPDLKHFLCTVYAPICFENVNGIKVLSLKPCRSLCESARNGCETQMKQYYKEWPAALRCDQFPDKQLNKEEQCVGKDEETSSRSYPARPKLSSRFDAAGHMSSVTRALGFVCPKNFEVPGSTLYLNGKAYSNCALPCEDVLLDQSSTQIVRFVTGVLSIVCLVSTLFTCSTFIADTKRFKYPSRPIIIIAFCQLMVASCYLIGFMTNNRISCNDPLEPPKALPNLKMIRTTVMGNRKGTCTLLFMALYFFQMSTMFWWLMMTISWYMIAKLKWAPEAIGNFSRYFHLFSWALPALFTIGLSVTGSIEGDTLTGTCYIGLSNQETNKLFVIYPMLTCIVVGCVFLVIGFKSIYESREALRREYGKLTTEHDKLVTRILVFSSLFVLFSVILLYCHYYEQNNLNLWMLSWLFKVCKIRDYSIPCPVGDFTEYAPHYSSFILKYAASMVMGLISALFMFSEKTFSTCRDLAELCHL